MSKKTGKLTKVEKFYIENNSDKSISELAKELNRSETSVKKYSESVKDDSHVTDAKSSDSQISSLMGHKEGRGVTVMTPAASELSDDTRGSRVANKKNQTGIHVIKKK